MIYIHVHVRMFVCMEYVFLDGGEFRQYKPYTKTDKGSVWHMLLSLQHIHIHVHALIIVEVYKINVFVPVSEVTSVYPHYLLLKYTMYITCKSFGIIINMYYM